MHNGYRIATALALALPAVAAPAQESGLEWPARPVRFVVPSSPGGGSDSYARLLAQALGEALRQRFVVDNRPGASQASLLMGPRGRAAPAISP